jgi:hypothetical protein
MSHKLLLVAFSICSSRAVLADDDHQLIMLVLQGFQVTRQVLSGLRDCREAGIGEAVRCATKTARRC